MNSPTSSPIRVLWNRPPFVYFLAGFTGLGAFLTFSSNETDSMTKPVEPSATLSCVNVAEVG